MSSNLAFKAKSEQVRLGATTTGLAYVLGKPKESIDVRSTTLDIGAVLARIAEDAPTVPTPTEDDVKWREWDPPFY